MTSHPAPHETTVVPAFVFAGSGRGARGAGAFVSFGATLALSLAGAVFADVLEHLANPGEILRRLVERLAPDARVLVAIPNAAWIPVLAALAAGRWDPTLAGVQARDHLTVFTPRSLAFS